MTQRVLLSTALASLIATAALAEDWPEYLHDSQRNARTDETLATPLHLQWVHTPARKPARAWPPPAKFDYYHNHGHRPVVVYDWAFQAVAAQGKVYYGSSADDGLHCLDARTGREIWVYYAEGPIRLAPACAHGKVVFAGDDGLIHAVDANTGRRVWVTRATPTDVRIAGNGRIISLWPNRTGVVIDGATVYAVLGLFPTQKMFVAAVDLADGKAISVTPTDQPVQGYVRHWQNRLLAPRGRQPRRATAGHTKEHKTPNALKAAGALAGECPHVQIGTKNLQIGGGDGKVVAYTVAPKPTRAWEAKVDGQARSLAVSDGRLFVGTTEGKLYCFAPQKVETGEVSPKAESITLAKKAVAAAAHVRKLLDAAGIHKGYALVLSNGGDLAGALAACTDLQVVCVIADPEKAQALARRFAAAPGRVSVHHVPADAKLPYSDWLFDVVTHDGVAAGKALTARRDEATRVLRPYGGLALLDAAPTVTLRTPPPEGAGAWTHFYANADNNACSGETRVGDTLRLQWFGRPGPQRMVDRHNRGVPPLARDGRLFVSGYDHLFCVNAFNGTVLWEHPVPNSARVHGPKVAGNMALAEDAVYITSGAGCVAFDVATGKETKTFSAGENSEWGCVATVGNTLIGSRCGPGAHVRRMSRMSWVPGYGPGQPNICSFDVFAFDRAAGNRLWTYEPKAGVVINTTILAAGGRLYFVESKNPATRQAGNSRVALPALLARGADLVALDLNTGAEAFRRTLDLKKVQHQLWMAHANGVLLISGVRSAQKIFTDLWALDAADGSGLWTHANATRGGDRSGGHGELTKRPAIIGNKVLAPPMQYDLRTGKPVAGWLWAGGSCGAISTSATHLYNRRGNPHMQSLTSRAASPVTKVTRPGCWINIIPACGMLLIPEGSSGCHCQFQVQTSMGFLPVP